MTWTQNYDPLGNVFLSTLVATLPVVVLLGAIAWLKIRIHYAAVLGLAVAMPVHAFAARVDIDSYFPLLMRFIVVPLGLFSAVYFPLSGLPLVVQRLAWVSPLWHAVELCRAATLTGAGLSWTTVLGHLAYLGAWAGAGFWLAVRSFASRLAV